MSEPYTRIGVIGAGVMGRGIAQVFAQSGARVVLIDQAQDALDAALDSVSKALDRAVAKGRMTAINATETLARITVSQDLGALSGQELIIEAIVEDLAVKARVLSDIGAIAPLAVLASNTSSLQISDISTAVSGRYPVVGLHFFNPPPVMKLVEVIFSPTTPTSVRERTVATLQSADKHPIICADTPGFIVNRCARPFYGEALAILEENAHSAAEIDAAMTAAGYRIGPFALIDLIGADVHLAATEGVAKGFGYHPRYHVFDALRAQVTRGHLGRKSGQGFVTPPQDVPAPANANAIVRRIEVMLVNEAATLLADSNISRGDIDVALRLGLNFPRGPFEIAANMDVSDIRKTLAKLRVAAPDALKARYDPAPGLELLEAS